MTPAQVAAAIERCREITVDKSAPIEVQNVAAIAIAALLDREIFRVRMEEALTHLGGRLPDLRGRATAPNPAMYEAAASLTFAFVEAEERPNAVDRALWKPPPGGGPYMGLQRLTPEMFKEESAPPPSLRVVPDEVPDVS